MLVALVGWLVRRASAGHPELFDGAAAQAQVDAHIAALSPPLNGPSPRPPGRTSPQKIVL